VVPFCCMQVSAAMPELMPCHPAPPELVSQALCWWCHCSVQAVDCAHVAGVEDECTVTAGTREQGPPLGAHNSCDLNIIWGHADTGRRDIAGPYKDVK
jgi:hypothetical protein